MEENMTFDGMKILNFHCYFENLEYVEEFDTEDGRHWEGRAQLDEWTDDIYQAAVECGYVDKCLKSWGITE